MYDITDDFTRDSTHAKQQSTTQIERHLVTKFVYVAKYISQPKITMMLTLRISAQELYIQQLEKRSHSIENWWMNQKQVKYRKKHLDKSLAACQEEIPKQDKH